MDLYINIIIFLSLLEKDKKLLIKLKVNTLKKIFNQLYTKMEFKIKILPYV